MSSGESCILHPLRASILMVQQPRPLHIPPSGRVYIRYLGEKLCNRCSTFSFNRTVTNISLDIIITSPLIVCLVPQATPKERSASHITEGGWLLRKMQWMLPKCCEYAFSGRRGGLVIPEIKPKPGDWIPGCGVNRVQPVPV